MNSSEKAEQFADVRNHLPFLRQREGLARILESLLCYPEVRAACAASANDKNPFARMMESFGLGIRMEDFAERVPAKGPVVVVANHGYGGADALAMMAAMTDLRDDFKILANREVTLLGGMERSVIPVSLLNGGDRGANSSGLRATLKHVKDGGALGIFPAGRVAFWQGDRMQDPAWNPNVVKLLRKMEATIVPLWFYGSPPGLINFLSRFSGLLRTALIPTGLVKMRGREITARAGEAIESRQLRELGEEAGPWLRSRLEFLAEVGN